ncbi:GtrA family protein [Maribellus maritimus]|uniref:GtrA family protein n=1 Tax=Maribellus maritimus TaxID=2870838 RepID=UPI001EEB467A|nr:GtrA family protein [Maribellus maritimus]MCG6188334.1 GtrA family protein [Maribellus maritimus]
MSYFFNKVRDLIIRIIDWFYFPFFKFIPIEIFRYAATGGANTLFDIFLYFVFYHFVLQMQIVDLGFVAISPHIAAFLMVFPITFTTGFLLAKYITFTASELRGRIQLFRYGVSVAGSVLLNYIFLKLFVEVAGMYATLAKGVTTFIVVVYSYIIQRYFSFKTNKILAAENVPD